MLIVSVQNWQTWLSNIWLTLQVLLIYIRHVLSFMMWAWTPLTPLLIAITQDGSPTRPVLFQRIEPQHRRRRFWHPLLYGCTATGRCTVSSRCSNYATCRLRLWSRQLERCRFFLLLLGTSLAVTVKAVQLHYVVWQKSLHRLSSRKRTVNTYKCIVIISFCYLGRYRKCLRRCVYNTVSRVTNECASPVNWNRIEPIKFSVYIGDQVLFITSRWRASQ